MQMAGCRYMYGIYNNPPVKKLFKNLMVSENIKYTDKSFTFQTVVTVKDYRGILFFQKFSNSQVLFWPIAASVRHYMCVAGIRFYNIFIIPLRVLFWKKKKKKKIGYDHNIFLINTLGAISSAKNRHTFPWMLKRTTILTRNRLK